MCDINLIDLSIDDDKMNIADISIAAKDMENLSSIGKQNEVLLTPHNCDFVSPLRRDSLENNPFDFVQKLANRPSDPFDIVESQARHCSQSEGFEVKVANLLSLSNDDILGEDDNNMVCENSPNHGFLLETKMKETEARKRLLKFSITNSTFNTPTGRVSFISPMHSGDSEESPLSQLFKSAVSHCSSEPMISAESPLKFVDDDLMCETPPSNLETDFDADLKMLTIPMLKDLSIAAADEKETYQNTPTHTPKTTATCDTMENLELLREKLRARRSEKKFNNDITGLIQNLKSLICDGDLADSEKKQRASSMLETLSKTLAETQILDKLYDEEKNTENLENSNNNLLNVPTPPPSIKRQGTFDMNLLQAECESENAKAEAIEGEPVVQQPDAMVSSTATYDGESAADKMGFELPEIEVPVTHSEEQQSHDNPAIDINDIVEQLNKLLNISHFPTTTTTADNVENNFSAATCNNSNNNPTFIVVMPTTQANAVILEQSFNNHSVAEHDSRAAVPRNVNAAAQAFRRRSQSLSLHDKLKIVKLPMAVSNLQEVATPSTVTEFSPPSSMPMHMLAAMGRDAGSRASGFVGDDFKTPSRLLRRNSYSSGTPYTPITHAQSNITRRSNLCNENMPNPRRSSSIMEEQMEKKKPQQTQPQRQTLSTVRTSTLPSRFDLKKKHYKSESIMKSGAPMKATIPLKKIMAPILKTSPPTPNRPNVSNRSHYQQRSATSQHLDNSMHFLSKSEQSPLTSTPMPLMHNLSALAAEGPLSFCSTPHVGPNINRSNMIRPRLSYAGNTPTSKTTPTASALAAGLSRRTLNELKHKSPIKAHTNSMGAVSRPYVSGRSSSSSITTTATTVKNTTSSTNRNFSTVSTSKPVSRLRAPLHGATTTGTGTSVSLNKENKRP